MGIINIGKHVDDPLHIWAKGMTKMTSISFAVLPNAINVRSKLFWFELAFQRVWWADYERQLAEEFVRWRDGAN